MASKKTTDVAHAGLASSEIEKLSTYNPLIQALQENDKKNLFKSNVVTAFIKTGYPLFDHYFGSVVNKHNELGAIITQEPRIGQAAGTFNMFVGSSQSGKLEPISTPIPTPDGWKRFGDLKEGDYVYTINGETTNIIKTFPQGVKDIYRYTLEDGRTFECGAEHLSLVNFTVDDLGRTSSVVDTLKIIELMNRGKRVWIPAYKNYANYPDSYTIDENNEIVKLEIKKIELDRQEEAMCIYVKHPSHLYVTNQMVITHNTTWATQISANIIKQFPYANVIHFDCEERFDITRCENITHLPASYFQSERYMIKTGAVGLDTIQEMIVKTYVTKVKMKDQLMADVGITDEFGLPIKILQPTVIIIDSITTVLSTTFNPESSKESADAEKMRSNTDGARDAKTLKGFFKDILPLCKEANIIIYAINHINNNMSMNAFLPPSKQQNYLKQDESIPGGRTMLYYPFNIIKLTAKTSDSFDDDSDGFTGHIVMVEPLKCSSNQSGNNSKGISFEMVFSQKYGFDSLRSLIWYGREHGIIEGNRNRLKFKGEDFTFNWKELDTEKMNKPIWDCVKKYIYPDLDQYLPYTEIGDFRFDDESLKY